jgi:hypothetical protein
VHGRTGIAFHADGHAIVTRKTGQIHVRRTSGSVNVLAWPFPGTLDTAAEKGPLGVVADPDVATRNLFYFLVLDGPTADEHRGYRTTLTAADTLTADTNPVVGLAGGHGPGLEGLACRAGGGRVLHTGMRSVGVGDTSANASPPTNRYGSCLNKGNGKILRVNLDGSIPAGNPLVGVAVVSGCATPTGSWLDALAPDPRIHAWCFRTPWR